jgi:hypothetical protein
LGFVLVGPNLATAMRLVHSGFVEHIFHLIYFSIQIAAQVMAKNVGYFGIFTCHRTG